MIDEETREFYTKMAVKQLIIGCFLVSGIVFLALSFTLYFLSSSIFAMVIDEVELSPNLFYFVFGVLDSSVIMGFIGFLMFISLFFVLLYNFWSERKCINLQRKGMGNNSTVCYCGNELPCPIHLY